MDHSLKIVIVNWNSGNNLRACLDAIEKAEKDGFRLASVTVVDNDSEDDSASNLGDYTFDLRLLTNPHNIGFAAACNRGAAGDSEYLLFLNPDTQIAADTLTRAVQFMRRPENRHIGICGARMTDGNGAPINSCSRFPTPAIFFGKASGLNRIFPAAFPSQELPAGELSRSRTVDQVIGAFFLVRGGLFRELGGFDERFFVYYEEVDFSLRAAQMGISSYYLRDAVVYHEGGACSSNDLPSRLFISLRSRLLFGYKHFTPAGKAALLFSTLVIEPPARIIHALWNRSYSEMGVTAKGYSLLLRQMPSIRSPLKS